MIDEDREKVRVLIEGALTHLKDNRLGLHLAPDGIFRVNDRWWAVLATDQEPESRTIVWDAIVHIEDILDEMEHDGIKLSVTAA